MRRTVVDGKKGSGRESGEGRVSAGTHGWVWPARSPRRGSSYGQTAQPPWRPSLPGRVASDCVGGRPRGRREKLRGVCQTGAPPYISEPPCLRVSVWLHSLGRRQNTFLPRLFARTIRTKRGSSSDGRASALHAEGRGIDALLLQFVFCLFSSDWFPFETREASDDAGLRPHVAKNHTFPGFLSLFLAACFLASANQEPSSPNQNVVSHRSVENRGRYASPASNKRPSGKAATVAGGAPLRARPARRGLRSIRNSSSRHAFEHIARSDARP